MNEVSTASLIDINSNSQGMPGGQASTMADYVDRYVAKPWLSQNVRNALLYLVENNPSYSHLEWGDRLTAHLRDNGAGPPIARANLDLSAMMRGCGQSRLFLTVGSPRVVGSPEVCSRLFPKPGMTGRAGHAWYEWQSRGALHTHTMHCLSPRRGSTLNAKESDIPLVA